MRISLEKIKKLRDETGAAVMDCRTALEMYDGDENQAKNWLKVKGLEKADKKSQREVKAGYVESYTHAGGKIGVLVELLCETDFVSRNEEFREFCHELCLQVAAMNPKSVDELLGQFWIRDETKKISDLLKEKIAKFGENMLIGRVIRFELGETA